MILSAFTHLWNPIGFPGVHYDEAIYMERGMRLLEGLGPQDPDWRYDHPFFGQFFLAGIFKILGYPESVNPNPDGGKPSIEGLYFVPRAIMGILAVIDTFLVYKIGEYRYGRKVAIVSSILFAVMPLSWLVRRIFLESILLPFLLLSILLAVYSGDTRSMKNKAKMISPVSYINILVVLLSGVSLGIAIFTKIPAFALIPLVGFLIFKNNKNLRLLALWFIPVIFIPLMWPIYAMSIGELDKWFDVERGVLWQVHRASRPLQDSVSAIFQMDPVLVFIGIIGTGYVAAVKKDLLPILWFFPFMAFLYLIQFSSYWHLIILLPLFCISGGTMIVDLSKRITHKNLTQRTMEDYTMTSKERIAQKVQVYGDFYLFYQDLTNILRPFKLILRPLKFLYRRYEKLSTNTILFIAVAGLSVFGLLSTTALVITSLNSSYFNAIAYLVQYLPDANATNSHDEKKDITVVGSPRYFWIPRYIFDKDYFYKGYTSVSPVQTDKIVIVADRGFRNELPENEVMQKIYNSTYPIAKFNQQSSDYNTEKYPYSNILFGYPDPDIEIRTSFK
jgi:uncharacterized protein Veg